MMRDNKAFASLTSGLLARKGQAKPAMRPQGFGSGQGQPDDLGWNDMGHDVPRSFGVHLPADLSGPATDPMPASLPPVVRQQQDIVREFASSPEDVAAEPEAPVVAERPTEEKKAASRKSRARAAVVTASVDAVLKGSRDGGRKAAFTLRLDTERHLRLRLACAVEHRSAQQIVTAALDHFLATLPDVERLAASLPVPGKSRV
jgi:hypothetical protein